MAARTPVITRIGGGGSTGNTPSGTGIGNLSFATTGALVAGHASLVIASSDSVGVSGISDGSNTYTKIGGDYLDSGSGNYVSIWLSLTGTARPVGATITVSTATATYGIAAVIYDVQDLAAASVLIGAAVQDSGGVTTGGDIVTAGVTTTQANILGLAIGEWQTRNTNSGSPLAPTAITASMTTWDADTPAYVESLTYVTAGGNYTGHRTRLDVNHRALASASGSYTATLTGGNGAYRQAIVALLKGYPNTAPNAPALASRSNFSATAAAVFSWTFSDPDAGDTQSAYQLVITDVAGGGTAYDSGKVTSTAQSLTLAANTLTNGHSYQWKVRTYDQDDLVGAYSSLGSFSVNAAPTASITSPATNGATVVTNSPTITWTYSGSGTQSGYGLRLLKAGVQQWASGFVSGASTSSALGATLVDAQSDYSVELTVYDAGGIASAAVTRTFVTAFTPPPTPTLTAAVDNTHARITLTYATAAPGGGQDTAVSVSLYRRVSGTSTWTLVKAGLAISGTYQDYAAAEDVTWEYRATAYGTLTGHADSLTATATGLHWDHGVWLHAVSDPAGTAHQFFDRGASGDAVKPAVTLTHYDGRTYPVAQFDATAADDQVTCELMLPWDLGGTQSSDRVALEALARRREVLCYRDHRSRRVFGVIAGGLQFADGVAGYTTTLTITPVDYAEG